MSLEIDAGGTFRIGNIVISFRTPLRGTPLLQDVGTLKQDLHNIDEAIERLKQRRAEIEKLLHGE